MREKREVLRNYRHETKKKKRLMSYRPSHSWRPAQHRETERQTHTDTRRERGEPTVEQNEDSYSCAYVGGRPPPVRSVRRKIKKNSP